MQFAIQDTLAEFPIFNQHFALLEHADMDTRTLLALLYLPPPPPNIENFILPLRAVSGFHLEYYQQRGTGYHYNQKDRNIAGIFKLSHV